MCFLLMVAQVLIGRIYKLRKQRKHRLATREESLNNEKTSRASIWLQYNPRTDV